MAYSDEDFEELAKVVRADLDIDDQVQLDAIELLKRLKRQGYIADYVRVPDEAMLDAEAKYNGAERKIFIRESVYQGAEDWKDHYRFTITHECAHALLNHQHERKRSFSRQAAFEKKIPSIRSDESEADRLAAAIISPFHKANFSLSTTIEQVKERFDLSEPAAKARLQTLSRIYRRRYNLPRPLPPGVIDLLAQRRREGHIVTSLPPEEIVAIRVRRPEYTGDACPVCGAFKMIRVGLHMKCDSPTCGARTGDD
jgi:Zn-dependent peptidase ImmA (M78 family)